MSQCSTLTVQASAVGSRLEPYTGASLGGLSFCCVPSGCLSSGALVPVNDPAAVVRVECSNDQCAGSQWMHRACFHAWETALVAYLRGVRGWSEQQCRHWLWRPAGLQLVLPACLCPSCQRGYLRRHHHDLPPDADPVDNFCGRKFTTTSATKLSLSVHTGTIAGDLDAMRGRTNSLGSNESSPSSGSDSPPSPLSCFQTAAALSGSTRRKLSKNFDLFDRIRHSSGNNFFRRLDFSVFNVLPRHKINSYHIKMEDESSQGNDETRSFLLSSLASARRAHTSCVLCASSMAVYDKYPIVDGTFFLSPRQHTRACVQVRYEGKLQYLSSVCMWCLEGWSGRLECVSCGRPWQGGHLVLGTLYTYDVFAASACCSRWLACTTCDRPVIDPDQRLSFFSDYSHILSCPFCTCVDHHFVKPLTMFRALPPPSPPAAAAAALTWREHASDTV